MSSVPALGLGSEIELSIIYTQMTNDLQRALNLSCHWLLRCVTFAFSMKSILKDFLDHLISSLGLSYLVASCFKAGCTTVHL